MKRKAKPPPSTPLTPEIWNAHAQALKELWDKASAGEDTPIEERKHLEIAGLGPIDPLLSPVFYDLSPEEKASDFLSYSDDEALTPREQQLVELVRKLMPKKKRSTMYR